MTLRNDIIVRQGETFSLTYVYKIAGVAVDLTGYSARMSVRDRYGGAQKAYFSSGSDADGGTITLPSSPTGAIVISMTAGESANIIEQLSSFGFADEMERARHAKSPEVYLYDLEVVSGATVTRVLEGKFLVYREVTE